MKRKIPGFQQRKRKQTSPVRTSVKEKTSNTSSAEDEVGCCTHADIPSYSEIVGSYFTPHYLKKYDFAVRACAACNKSFGTEIKVTSKKPVHACKNASFTNNECMHAYCDRCHGKLANNSDHASTGRPKRIKVVTK